MLRRAAQLGMQFIRNLLGHSAPPHIARMGGFRKVAADAEDDGADHRHRKPLTYGAGRGSSSSTAVAGGSVPLAEFPKTAPSSCTRSHLAVVLVVANLIVVIGIVYVITPYVIAPSLLLGPLPHQRGKGRGLPFHHASTPPHHAGAPAHGAPVPAAATVAIADSPTAKGSAAASSFERAAVTTQAYAGRPSEAMMAARLSATQLSTPIPDAPPTVAVAAGSTSGLAAPLAAAHEASTGSDPIAAAATATAVAVPTATAVAVPTASSAATQLPLATSITEPPPADWPATAARSHWLQ